MPETLELNKAVMVEDIVSSYEARIENINTFFETTQLILSDFQDPLHDSREERGQISCQLQDLLAKNEHLRKTDFNRMMQGIFAIQVAKEKEIRNVVNNFLTEQREMVHLLRDNLDKIKAALANGQGVEVKQSKELMSQILSQQDKKRQEVSLKLKEFQKEQKEMTQRLVELLAKGRELRINDLKSMLREFDIQHNQRIAQQMERKVEVKKRKEKIQALMVEFKKKRQESVKNRRSIPSKITPPVGPQIESED